MDATYLHGPDRAPFTVGADGTVSVPDGNGLPFHGIVSRGLAAWLDADGGGPEAWMRDAHWLHDRGAEPTADLRALRAAAARLGVLSFGASALAATAYVEQRLDPERAELWSTKEGHTSSVWVVTVDAATRFVLNVARDAAAARELRDTSERLRLLAAAAPDLAIAAVEDLADVEVDGGRTVLVARNALVEDAREIHRLPDGRGYALVDRFLAGDDGDAPARIHAVVGRVVTPAEHAAIEQALVRIADVARHDLPLAPDVDDGDLVWDGARVHVVAIG